MASQTWCLMDRCVLIKNTNGWKAIIIFISLYLSSKVHGTDFTVCAKTDTDNASISLNCSSKQMIHVIGELYGRRTSEDNCTVVRADSNTKLFASSNNGLTVNCNGYKQCTEQVACDEHCKGSGNAFEILYECVEDDSDSCSVLNKTGPLTTLYIHSPRFPDISRKENNCECIVSGQSLDVLMIQQRGLKGVLQIITTGAKNHTWTRNNIHTNRKIASDGTHVVISYRNQANRTFWLKISGNVTHVTCSTSATPTETTEFESARMMTTPVSSTKITPSPLSNQTGMTTSSVYSSDTETTANSHNSYTTDRGRSSDEVSSTQIPPSSLSYQTGVTTSSVYSTESITVITVSVVCGVIIFLVLVIIGLLLLYFKVIKPQRQRQNNTQERVSNNGTDNDNISGSNEQRNTYSNLVRYSNQDNDYGKLHLYANP